MSTPVAWKVGTTIQDKFILKDRATGAGMTGYVQANFTIKISRSTTGNISTTGLTITEVDAVNNPGAYAVTVSGSTGFVATTTGEYTVVIHLTADETYKFEQVYYVTSDGTFGGTVGAASFTATASDGRITNGVSALSGATVRIRDASNRVLYSLTSSATGVWGPVYLDSTVTVDVQLAGYAVNNSSTITVVGSTATGPLADIALTAISSSTTITNNDLLAYARRMARNANGSQSDTELQQAVNSALKWVATAKLWERYKTYGDIALQAPYSTGTIALVNASTTVTLTGGTWPTWAASGKLKIGGKVYRIASRTSGAVVVLAKAWQAASDSAATYVIFQDEYSLPTDCLRFGAVYPGEGWGWGGEPVSFETILQAQNVGTYGETYPAAYAVHGSGGTEKVIFFPYPSAANLLPFWYYRAPAQLVNGTDTADFDALHLELLHRAIDYQVAICYESCVAGTPEKCMARLMESMPRNASNDKAPTHVAGPLGSAGARAPVRPRLG